MKYLDLLKLLETKSIKDLDSYETAFIHKDIIQKKLFLKKLYKDFYNELKKILQIVPEGKPVELGSGSGFLKQLMPSVITSDIFPMKDIDMVFPATEIPFKDNTVSVFFLLNVLHHIKDPTQFFNEASRCLVNNGRILMIEPNNSILGRFIFKNFHHELFDPGAGWKTDQGGRLSGANQALAWIIFFRDRKKFEKEFPTLRINKLTPHTPFRYLISGGLSFRQLLPSFTYNIIKVIEILLSPLNKYFGMFITIELEKVHHE